MARVLITGASGLLGANLVFSARPEDEVTAVFHQHPIDRLGVRCLSADLSQPGAAEDLFSDLAPQWVVHCAAATDWATRLNRDMAGAVARAAYDVGARLAHISTDAVFDGSRSPNVETEATSPINVYGRTKLEGEWAVMKAYPGAAVVRTNLYAWGAYPHRGLAAWFLEQLENDRSCRGFTDVVFSPILANHLATWLWDLLDAGMGGICHIGGGSCLSKYEFGVKLAEAFGHDAGLIQASSLPDAGLTAPRPKRLCLDSSRIEHELEQALPSIEAGIAELRAMALDGRREQLNAMVPV
jgi:dTDP-4-dehydrorhamnose reductase